MSKYYPILASGRRGDGIRQGREHASASSPGREHAKTDMYVNDLTMKEGSLFRNTKSYSTNKNSLFTKQGKLFNKQGKVFNKQGNSYSTHKTLFVE